MTEFIQDGLFTPFKKEDPFSQGLGLSLAVSRHLADATGSHIAVLDSAVGRGSHFVFSFPVAMYRSPETPWQPANRYHLVPSDGEDVVSVLSHCRCLLSEFFDVRCGVASGTQPLRIVDYDTDLPADQELMGCTSHTMLLCQPDTIPLISDKIIKLPHVVLCTKPIGVPRLRAGLKELATKHVEHLKQKQRQEKRILIVDDNAVNRNMLAMYCRKRKFYFETASDGIEAIERFKAGGFNIIFMDIQMPNCDGPTAVQHIRRCENEQVGTGCTIIMLTGLSAVEMTNQSKEAGADAIYGKPVSLKTLDAILGVGQ